MQKLNEINGAECSCGREHKFNSRLVMGNGAVLKISKIIKDTGAKKAYVIADENTYGVAGKRVVEILSESGVNYVLYKFGQSRPEPDERNVGCAFMHMPLDCDVIIGIGSGVINDISKIVAARSGLQFIIVATAPSMDGYASMSSSVTLDGIKVSLPSRCADVVIGDVEIIKTAPVEMLLSGIGDMIAKYVSICEWRIASVLVGEYYCERVAELVRDAVRRTVVAAPAAISGDGDAINEIFHALIVGSVAMNYAGISRPASGAEHYISHLYDTRGVELGEPTSFHGTQCAIATLYVVRLYEKLRMLTPDRDKALRYVAGFDGEAWNAKLESLLGRSAKPLIALEEKEGKYDVEKHRERLEIIIEKWDEILEIIMEEIPDSEWLEDFMKKLGMATTFGEVGMREDVLDEIFRASKDIRDKYVLPRLLWDLGVIDSFL